MAKVKCKGLTWRAAQAARCLEAASAIKPSVYNSPKAAGEVFTGWLDEAKQYIAEIDDLINEAKAKEGEV